MLKYYESGFLSFLGFTISYRLPIPLVLYFFLKFYLFVIYLFTPNASPFQVPPNRVPRVLLFPHLLSSERVGQPNPDPSSLCRIRSISDRAAMLGKRYYSQVTTLRRAPSPVVGGPTRRQSCMSSGSYNLYI